MSPRPIGRRPRRPARRTVSVTPVGIRYLLLCLAVGLAAANTGNNLLYLLLAMMLSLIIVSGLMSERTLQRLSATRTLPPRLVAGSATTCRITLYNGKRLMPGFSLRVRERPNGIRLIAEETSCPRLAPGQRVDFDTTVTFTDRGLHHLDGLEVTTTFPFGLFAKTFRLPVPAQSLVYPAIDPVPGLAARREPGDGSARGRWRGTSGLQTLRDYHSGDDPRFIHWKHSARRSKLVVREPEYEEGRSAVFIFSNRLPPEPLPIHLAWFEDAVRLTASLVSRALNDGFDVTLATWDGASRSGRGKGQIDRLLRTLATVAPTAKPIHDRLIPWTMALPNPAPHLILMWDDPAWSRIRPRCERVWVIAQQGAPSGRTA